MGKVVVVVGGQFGSEGKGRVAADLAVRETSPPLVVRVGGPNAGHCVVDNDGFEWKLRHLPTAAISRPDADLAIAPGSEVNPKLLADEIMAVEDTFGKGYITDRLYIDPEATVIITAHIDSEDRLKKRIGSTGSGVGAARAARVWRQAKRIGDIESEWSQRRTPWFAQDWLRDGGTVIIEGCQGYGLGLHAGHYPYCSSANFRAIDMLGMSGISPWDPGVSALQVWVVMRTLPIRVGGDSGPLYMETSWQEKDLPEERTTVTNKVRRVGEWDKSLAYEAIQANGGHVAVALTMVDHVRRDLEGQTEWTPQIDDVAKEYEQSLGGAEIWAIGTSKTTAAWKQTALLGV